MEVEVDSKCGEIDFDVTVIPVVLLASPSTVPVVISLSSHPPSSQTSSDN